MLTAVQLGPLTARVCAAARWRGQDQFPAWQVWADEIERVLSFAHSCAQFDRFFKRLTASRTQRDEALQELRAAFFFDRSGFPATSWEPPGAGGLLGEFCLRTPDLADIFVEVKSPGWESELTAQEIKAGRAKIEKYPGIEARPVAPWRNIRFAIRKAYSKFSSAQPNLLVIADDLFVNLTEWGGNLPAGMALFANHNTLDGELGYFLSNKFENLGGVGLFFARGSDRQIHYVFKLHVNPRALPSTRLPQEFIYAFDAVRINLTRSPKEQEKITL